MKKLKGILFTMLVTTAAWQSTAQNYALPGARSGLKVGFNASNLYSDKVTDRNPRYGFNAAFFTQKPLGANFYLQPEIGYSAKGLTARYDIANFKGENSFNIDYLEVPLLLTYKLGNVVDLQAGGYGGLLVSAKNVSKNELGTSVADLNKSDYNTFDYGLSTGINLYMGQLMIGTRYNYGLRGVAKSDGAKTFLGNAKNSVGQLTLGVTF